MLVHQRVLQHHWEHWSHHPQENIDFFPTPAIRRSFTFFGGPGKNIPYHDPLWEYPISSEKQSSIPLFGRVYHWLRGWYPQRFHISSWFLIRKIKHHLKQSRGTGSKVKFSGLSTINTKPCRSESSLAIFSARHHPLLAHVYLFWGEQSF